MKYKVFYQPNDTSTVEATFNTLEEVKERLKGYKPGNFGVGEYRLFSVHPRIGLLPHDLTKNYGVEA